VLYVGVMKPWTPFAIACVAFAVAGPGIAGAQTAPAGKGLAYRVFADVVAARICIPRSTFNPGDTTVWRAEIQDPSGVRLTDERIKALGITAAVTFKDGTKVPLKFGIHPPFPNPPATDTYWAGALFIKNDHPTGTMPWTVTVTDAAGNTVNFTPIGQNNGLSVLTIAEKAPAPPKS
jgi:hypothetical protein